MAKTVHDLVLDATLNFIKTGTTKLCVCSAQPTTYEEATSTYTLASKVISTSNFFAPADGDTSGRKLVLKAVGGILVESSDDAEYIALVDTVNSRLLYVYPCATASITAGKYIKVSASTIELRDPQ